MPGVATRKAGSIDTEPLRGILPRIVDNIAGAAPEVEQACCRDEVILMIWIPDWLGWLCHDRFNPVPRKMMRKKYGGLPGRKPP